MPAKRKPRKPKLARFRDIDLPATNTLYFYPSEDKNGAPVVGSNSSGIVEFKSHDARRLRDWLNRYLAWREARGEK